MVLIAMVSFLVSVKSDAVCTEQVLITELRQDILDNGKLDCLRVVQPAPADVEETDLMRKNRIAAVWDTDCAFEASYNWLGQLKEYYGLEKGLVDVNGKPVKRDFDDQADMCEMVRALIAGGAMPGANPNVQKIEVDVLDGIDCPGNADQGQSEICAATGGSPAQGYSWYIFLHGGTFTIDGKPG